MHRALQKTALAQLEAARAIALDAAPRAVRATVKALRFVADHRCKALRVQADGSCRYCPAFCVACSLATLAGCVLHEALHVAEAHAAEAIRMKAHAPTWVVAAELRANAVVNRAGLELPEHTLTPKRFDLPDNWRAPGYYLALSNRRRASLQRA